MDINVLFTLGAMLVTVTAFIVTTSVLVNVTRADFKDFKNLVETRFAAVDGRFTEMENRFDARFVEMENRFDGKFSEMENRFDSRFVEMENRFDGKFSEMENRFDGKFGGMENRLNRLEVDVAEIKAICRERTGRDTPV